MKIKVIIVDQDKNYTMHVLNSFQKTHSDRVELKIFSNVQDFYQEISVSYADLILVDCDLKFDLSRIPDNSSYGYLCDKKDIEEIDGISAICKYQKVDTLYKSMLGLFAEKAANIKFKHNGSDIHTTLFTSVQGGSGTSAAAAAYALSRAKEGRKVFYLNLQKFGDSDIYFSGDGNMSFSDVIYALKSRKSNLIIKLESAIKTDISGVDFFSTCRNAYDMFELKDSEIITLIQGISQVKNYDEIIIDISGDVNERMETLIEDTSDSIVYVCDGSAVGNRKFERFCEVIRVLEQKNEFNILGKISLLYNRYSSKNSSQMEKIPVNLLGGIHRIEGINGRELIEQISLLGILKQV